VENFTLGSKVMRVTYYTDKQGVRGLFH